MSGACVGPGPRSLEGLAWLARVGATPLEPLRLAVGWTEPRAHDHMRRLVDAGLVRRVAMRRGQGSLLVVTSRGAREAGYPARRAPRSIGPTTWAHACACAWVSAWFHVRGRVWCSERHVADDDFWRQDLHYQDHRGTVRMTHRPDLGVIMPLGPIAVEVELQRKMRKRLLGIIMMYAQLTEGDDSPIAAVLYVCGYRDIEDLVTSLADYASLFRQQLKIRMLNVVIEETRAAARERTGTAP